MKNISAKNINVTGNVQGVFFRAHAKELADQLGIKGFVENREDGSVFIHAEGNEDALNELEEWCHHGPPDAKVESVRAKDVIEIGMELFEIR